MSDRARNPNPLYTLKNIHVIPYHGELLNAVCEDLLKRCSHLLPNLHDVVVFLPGVLMFKPLRENLIRHAAGYGHESLILPVFTTLRDWVLSHCPPDKPLLSQYARELVLVDAIKQRPGIFSDASPWMIASELLTFFDAMQRNNITADRLQDHFAEYQPDASRMLSQEAEMVTVLWGAWQQQLSRENLLDPVEAYVRAAGKVAPPKRNVYYVADLDRFSECELLLLEKIDAHAPLRVFLYGSGPTFSSRADPVIKDLITPETNVIPPSDEATPPYSAFLDAAFSDDERKVKQRAEEFRSAHPVSPAMQHLKIYKSSSFEHHAKAIDVTIRRYLYEDKKNIGIVTGDRKLVRRLRALLEHANVAINDLSGWELATTSTAVIIELWLQIIEEDYSAKLLLALLRSPFFPVSVTRNRHDEAVDFFEKDLVLARGIKDRLSRYQGALQRLRDNRKGAQHCDYLLELLHQLETATAKLAELQRGKPVPLHHFIKALLVGIQTFGIYDLLKNDDAGAQIIELLESQAAHLEKIDNTMKWLECRRFLARILEQQNYKPPLSPEAKVTLFSLEQTRLLQFDALIIASVDKNHFPGNPESYIFFNERVRTELNVPTHFDKHAIHLHLFRRLLNAAPEVMITFQNERDGEKNAFSPWLQIIETFHRMAYGNDLLDTELQHLVAHSDTGVIGPQQRIPMPAPSSRPSPALTEGLKPDKISISQYQALVNCPYQFFTRACLKLYKTDELKETLGKDDFGSLVHKCIEAFFEDRQFMPGPFPEKVTTDTRHAAEDMLVTISEHVFERHPESGFSKQLWLRRWLTLIPHYIDWEIRRQQDGYTPHKHESKLEEDITPSTSIRGRVDRIDRIDTDDDADTDTEYAIIDYKTGYTPSKKDIAAGEQIQLPAYALLHKNCKRVEYVNIGKNDTVKTEAAFEGLQLEQLVDKHNERLTEFFKVLDDNPRFTALAEDEVCDWCEAKGLCRKDYW